MSRDVTVGTLAALEAKAVKPVIFVYLDFLGGAVRVNSSPNDAVFAGNTFLGVGLLGGISTIEESKSVSANGITLTLAAPSSLVSLALQEHYRTRPAKIWLGAFDGAGAVIADPVQIWSGRMDTMKIDHGGEISLINLTCETRIIDLNRSRERRYTHEEQQRLYPGDLALEYLTTIISENIAWGTPTAYSPLSRGDIGNGNDEVTDQL